MWTLVIVTALLGALAIIFSFPYLELRRFTELQPTEPDLAARVLSTIDANNDFDGGELIIDVSERVCAWASPDGLHALIEQPGWQLTARYDGIFWFKKTSFWPWDRDGLQIGLNDEPGCYAYVRRSDAI
jgi:hypothetical protein